MKEQHIKSPARRSLVKMYLSAKSAIFCATKARRETNEAISTKPNLEPQEEA